MRVPSNYPTNSKIITVSHFRTSPSRNNKNDDVTVVLTDTLAGTLDYFESQEVDERSNSDRPVRTNCTLVHPTSTSCATPGTGCSGDVRVITQITTCKDLPVPQWHSRVVTKRGYILSNGFQEVTSSSRRILLRSLQLRNSLVGALTRPTTGRKERTWKQPLKTWGVSSLSAFGGEGCFVKKRGGWVPVRASTEPAITYSLYDGG